MNGSVLDLFAKNGSLVAKDVSPWQTFSGKGMKFRLQSFDWDGCACLSHLTMRAFLGTMHMETVICTPYAKDLPIFSYDFINALGRRTLLVEVYDEGLATKPPRHSSAGSFSVRNKWLAQLPTMTNKT